MITTELKNTTFNFDSLLKELESNQKLKHQLIQLYDKWKAQRFTIGFTGHFSAGKSTLINALIEEELLPSSPIPTSANIVEVRHGDDQTIYDLNDGRQAIEPEINLNHVKELARNGEDVRSITVNKPVKLLENSVALMDTPGIDSSDDEEFKRTLANIHLIDYFVYVMDYNHVQSEVNFKFLRELQDNQIPFIVVVNQVDKHNEDELLFDSFKKSLKDSCHAWNIEPQAIFYTSLIDYSHSLNQLNQLKSFIQDKIDHSSDLIEQKLALEIEHLIEQWTEYKYNLNNHEFENLSELRLSNERLIDEINTFKNDQENFIQNTNSQLTNVLNNAYIMTFEARELAKEYLISLQPTFKVGKLFYKKKTEEEINRRAEVFQSMIHERVKTEMAWHVRHLLINQMNEYNLENHNLVDKVQGFSVDVTQHDLYQSVNLSAEVNGDSVLRYTDQLQKQLAQKIKHEVTPLINEMNQLVQKDLESKINHLENKLIENEKEIDQYNNVANVEKEKESFKLTVTEQTFEQSSSHELIENEYKNFTNRITVQVSDLLINKSKPIIDEQVPMTSNKPSLDMDHLVQQSEKILTMIEPIKPLRSFYESLNQQLIKVNQSEMTVALFGAFSAGKSSFANAWIGANVLPSSPNPTTAAINKICPITDENGHEDVQVLFKTEEQLVKQLSNIINPFTSQLFNHIDELIKFLRKNFERFSYQLSKTESSFVEAFLSGVDGSKRLLGKTKKISLGEFSKYVTVESISCFVEEITVYYDCELTRQGITLVDTPGADSIHARHTNTSFHYVKHSDAIIYVNYYNHAFSRADREFLIQLGRVKEAFALDKMFFILNASDLAKDEQELKLVEEYLNDQLKQYGISDPSIYALSSKEILDGNELSKSNDFFTRFDQFIHSDSKELIASKLRDEHQRLKQYIVTTLEEASSSVDTQRNKVNQLEKEVDQIESWVHSLDNQIYIQSIYQEIDELTHYMKDRINIQLNDLMKETINPATVTSNGKKGKDQLEIAIKKMLSHLNHRLSNEFNATHILLDQKLTFSINDWLKQVNQYITNQTSLSKAYNDLDTFNEIKENYNEELLNEQDINSLAQMYKNKKDFFEDQKVKEVYSELYQLVQTSIVARISQMKEQLQFHYEHEFNRVSGEIVHNYLEQSNNLIQQKLEIYEDDQLQNELENLKELV